MPGLSLQSDALSVRDLFRFLRDLNLDCDINPCTAWIGRLDPERVADPVGATEFVRELGLTQALANLFGVAEADVATTVVMHETHVDGEVDRLAELVSDHHNTRALGLDEAVHIACWPHVNGEHVVFVKMNHMVVDLSDTLAVLGAVRAWLQGRPHRRVGRRYREHADLLARYAALPAADPTLVERELGELSRPGRRGIPTIAEADEQWLPLRRGVSFDELLSAVTDTVLRYIGGRLVLQCPASRWEFAGKGGYFVEIKPLVVDEESTSEYTPGYFRRRRELYESLGRLTVSDLTSFGAEFSRFRMPRIVVSDTTFMRPEPGSWRWVPVRSRRMFDDLRFLADRSLPGPPLLRLQYKTAFLPADEAKGMLGELEERVGSGGGSVGAAR